GRGNLKAEYEGENAFRTSNPKVFAAGDGRRGQSLVVYAIAEGRRCAEAVNSFLREEN
ncbi:MAG TPA: glutamate synthase, partial [Succinivibrionaceae bacterium]|nr:glutamate synthase [Succinivibrionaceae bacterium]